MMIAPSTTVQNVYHQNIIDSSNQRQRCTASAGRSTYHLGVIFLCRDKIGKKRKANILRLLAAMKSDNKGWPPVSSENRRRFDSIVEGNVFTAVDFFSGYWKTKLNHGFKH